jgi:nucleoside-diphosphate-sugar epimerase
MRILITGANGLIGKNIAKTFIATPQVDVFCHLAQKAKH